MNTMISRVFRWFIANSILGILVALFCFCTIDWFLTGKFEFIYTFKDFLWSGYFTFTAVTLIFSLVEDYPIFMKAKIGFASGVWLTILVISTMFFFYSDYKSHFQFIKEHSIQFAIIWFMSASSATLIKYRIISHQKFS